MAETTEKNVDYTKKLPDAEFEIMRAIWQAQKDPDAVITSAYLMRTTGKEHGWKAPTVTSFLVRLEEKGFVTSKKEGKERVYTAVADEDLYFYAVTQQFVNQYHGGSMVHLLDVFTMGRELTEEEFASLLGWLKTK